MDQKFLSCHALNGMSKSDNNVCWNFILLFLQIAKCQGRIIWGIAMKACFVMGMQTFGRGQMNFFWVLLLMWLEEDLLVKFWFRM